MLLDLAHQNQVVSLETRETTIFVAVNSTAASADPVIRTANGPGRSVPADEAADLTHVLANQLGWLFQQQCKPGGLHNAAVRIISVVRSHLQIRQFGRHALRHAWL